MMLFQVLKIFIPNKFTSSRILHRTIYWGLRTFVRPDANYLILRHFHIGSEILQFVASNVPGVSDPAESAAARETSKDLIDDVFLKHDLNIYNFLIRVNREMKAKGITADASSRISTSTASPTGRSRSTRTACRRPPERARSGDRDRDLHAAVSAVPDRQRFLARLQFAAAGRDRRDLHIEADGRPSYVSLVNNKHPLIPLSTLQAGYRLLLHGLAAECLHATLVQFKRRAREATRH